LCFLPGPCCGNTQGQCVHCILSLYSPCALRGGPSRPALLAASTVQFRP
jgi:hypothetical protein